MPSTVDGSKECIKVYSYNAQVRDRRFAGYAHTVVRPCGRVHAEAFARMLTESSALFTLLLIIPRFKNRCLPPHPCSLKSRRYSGGNCTLKDGVPRQARSSLCARRRINQVLGKLQSPVYQPERMSVRWHIVPLIARSEDHLSTLGCRLRDPNFHLPLPSTRSLEVGRRW